MTHLLQQSHTSQPFPNSPTDWGPSFQTHEPTGVILFETSKIIVLLLKSSFSQSHGILWLHRIALKWRQSYLPAMRSCMCDLTLLCFSSFIPWSWTVETGYHFSHHNYHCYCYCNYYYSSCYLKKLSKRNIIKISLRATDCRKCPTVLRDLIFGGIAVLVFWKSNSVFLAFQAFWKSWY